MQLLILPLAQESRLDAIEDILLSHIAKLVTRPPHPTYVEN